MQGVLAWVLSLSIDFFGAMSPVTVNRQLSGWALICNFDPMALPHKFVGYGSVQPQPPALWIMCPWMHEPVLVSLLDVVWDCVRFRGCVLLAVPTPSLQSPPARKFLGFVQGPWCSYLPSFRPTAAYFASNVCCRDQLCPANHYTCSVWHLWHLCE
jgi:hypothetical protein